MTDSVQRQLAAFGSSYSTESTFPKQLNTNYSSQTNGTGNNLVTKTLGSQYQLGASVWKIGRLNTWYWGSGGVLVEVWHSGYTDFDYGKYLLYGHTDKPSGKTVAVRTLITPTSSITAPYFQPIVYKDNADANSQGYAELRMAVPSYYQYTIRVTAPHWMGSMTDANGTGYSWWSNSFQFYPDGSVV